MAEPNTVIVKDNKIGTAAIVVACLSFIPGLGVFFGVAAVIMAFIGFANKKRQAWLVMLLGVLGIAFTIALYSTLFYMAFEQKGGIYSKLWGQMAEQNLAKTVKDIEFYKLRHGQYPENIKQLEAELQPAEKMDVIDVSHMSLQMATGGGNNYFYYELTPDHSHYYLLGTGEDGKAFTADDVVPNLGAEQNGNIGLLIKK